MMSRVDCFGRFLRVEDVLIQINSVRFIYPSKGAILDQWILMTTIGKQSQGLGQVGKDSIVVPTLFDKNRSHGNSDRSQAPRAALFGLRGAYKKAYDHCMLRLGPGGNVGQGGSPNTIAWLSLTKVGRKVQSSQVFSRNSPFDPRSALPAQSRLLTQ